MAREPNVFPSYQLHRPTGQARIRIAGKDSYLGEYGSEESRIPYGELFAKHASGTQIDPFATCTSPGAYFVETDPAF